MAPRAPKEAPRRPPEAPRWLQVGPKTAPRWTQDGPKSPKTAPRWPQDGSKSAPSRFQIAFERHLNSKTFQHAPKTALGPPGGAPRGPQELPKAPQEAPKRLPRGPQEAPNSAQEAHKRLSRAPWQPKVTPKLQQHAPRQTHPTLNPTASTTADQLHTGVAGDAPQALSIRRPLT